MGQLLILYNFITKIFFISEIHQTVIGPKKRHVPSLRMAISKIWIRDWKNLINKMINVLFVQKKRPCDKTCLKNPHLLTQLKLTVSFVLSNLWPFLHHVMLAGGLDPELWHSKSYRLPDDNGWFAPKIFTSNGPTATTRNRHINYETCGAFGKRVSKPPCLFDFIVFHRQITFH